MKRRPSTAAAIVLIGLATSVFAQRASNGSVAIVHHAKGVFDIKLTPMPADDYADGKALPSK